MRRAVRAAAGVAISVLIALAFGEIFLRIFLPQQESMRWFETSDDYGYVNKKNFHQRYRYTGSEFVMDIVTNSLGFRDDEVDIQNLDDSKKTRIVFLGDSFTFGYGIEMKDRFDKTLVKMLNKDNNDYISINLGVGGWGTLQETKYLTDHFDAFKPDVVVLTYCANDPGDDESFKAGLKDDDQGVFKIPGKVFLRDHSHLYRFLFYRFARIVQNGAFYLRLAGRQGQGGDIVFSDGASITAEQWENTKRYIYAFHDAFKTFNKNGVLLIQATAPWDDRVRSQLRKIQNGRDIIFVDLYDETISLSESERRTPHDGHWSPLVHDISARALYNAIHREAFLGGSRLLAERSRD